MRTSRDQINSVNDKSAWCYGSIAVAGLVTLIVVLSVAIHDESNEKKPRFQIESVSVYNDKRTAVWDIGFSVTVWAISFSIDKSLADLTVWVRFKARDYKVESVGNAGNATVSVTTPPLVGAPAVLEQVMFRCSNYHDYVLEAACKDVTSTPAGVMEGGPKLCPVVRYEPFS